MNTLEVLQKNFGNMDGIAFQRLESGIILAVIDNPLATATVSLYGGHIVEWRPKSQAVPVLWRSKQARFVPGKAIRAGVPVCWPWFGPHLTDPASPAHGYARISPWEVTSVSTREAGATEMVLTMPETDGAPAYRDFSGRLSIRISIGDVLSIALTTTNVGKQDIFITEALHTYLNVSDVANVRVDGLNGCEYIDSVRGNAREQQSGAVQFSERLDRVYLNTDTDCVIEDPGFSRRINVSKSGSLSTVVWNPWLAIASHMDDIGPDGWRTMLCVESANALENRVTVKPGTTHVLCLTCSAQSMG